MKHLLLPVFCILVSCAGKGTMTVVSRNSEGITVSGDWRHHTSHPTKSAVRAQEWFATEAAKLAQAEGKQAGSVQIQSATLTYNILSSTCKATLTGAAYFGGSSAGPSFYDGSTLTTLAIKEEQRATKIRANIAMLAAAASAAGASIAAANAETARQNAEFYEQMAAQSRSRPITVPNLSLRSQVYQPSVDFSKMRTPRMTYNMPSPSLPLVTGSSGSSSRTSRYSGSSSSIPMLPTPSLSSTIARSSPRTYASSSSLGLSSGLPVRKGQFSGDTFYHADGSRSTRAGNKWYHPDGTTTTRVGDTVYKADGTTSTKSGNTWYHSSGKTSTQEGNTLRNSDGSSYTVGSDGTMYYKGRGY